VIGAPPRPPPPHPPLPIPPTDNETVIAKSERFVIYRPKQGDTLRTLAARLLGDEERYWEIAEFNGVSRAEPGQLLVVPLQPVNPRGIFRDGYRTVPILCYHRFGQKDGKMVVSPEAFAAQLNYLAQNDYHVVPLTALLDFLAGQRPLPKRAVVLTFDDGYASFYHYAFPLLKEHGFPATVFLYSDFVGARDALTWPQMVEMAASGLIDIQAHSKTHANLAYRLPDEDEAHYRKRLEAEVRVPRDVLQNKLRESVTSFAYPYGDTNGVLMDLLAKADYRLAVTVHPGANPFFAYPLALSRSMIFGDDDIDAFKTKLQTYRQVDLQ